MSTTRQRDAVVALESGLLKVAAVGPTPQRTETRTITRHRAELVVGVERVCSAMCAFSVALLCSSHLYREFSTRTEKIAYLKEQEESLGGEDSLSRESITFTEADLNREGEEETVRLRSDKALLEAQLEETRTKLATFKSEIGSHLYCVHVAFAAHSAPLLGNFRDISLKQMQASPTFREGAHLCSAQIALERAFASQSVALLHSCLSTVRVASTEPRALCSDTALNS